MTDRPEDLRFYFIADAKNKILQHDPEAGHDIAIAGVGDLVRVVMCKVADTPMARVRALIVSGHSSVNHFYIGADAINMFSFRRTFRRQLVVLTPFFHPEAQVFIAGGSAGAGQALLLRALSRAWGGVRVTGWRERIAVGDSIFADFLSHPLGRVACKMTGGGALKIAASGRFS